MMSSLGCIPQLSRINISANILATKCINFGVPNYLCLQYDIPKYIFNLNISTAPQPPSESTIGEAFEEASQKDGQYRHCVLAAATKLVCYGFGIDNTSEGSVRDEFRRAEKPLLPETTVVIRNNDTGPAAEIGCTVCGHVVAMYGVVDAQKIGTPKDPKSPDCPLEEYVAPVEEDTAWLVE